MIGDLVDVVSKNGALLLNIGPKPDGTIPDGDADILRAIGRWLSINGEAIYETRPWTIYGEGPTEVSEGSFTDTARNPFTGQDIRFTTKGDMLYAIALAWPGEEVVIKSLGKASPQQTSAVASVSLLGAGSVAWTQDDSGLRIKLPQQAPGEHAFTFKIAFA
ncbi:hypothetical protein B7486_78035 [cyanobacterium TDX16]|nr:hypothetical protein B7486_78035 [cyanobacterium TDX16]